MITINSGKLCIPNEEYVIGFTGDNLHTKKQFLLENFADENCTHSLYLKFYNGAVKDLVLDSKVENGSTILTWNVLREHILKSGLVKAQIKSTFENGETSHTTWNYFYVFPSTEISEEFGDIDITEFDDYTQKLNEIYDKLSDKDFDAFVTSDRAIAGIHLKNDIDASVLCEALKVHPTIFKEGAPTVNDGVVGEYLIDTLNNDLYYCKKHSLSGNDWIKLTGSVNNISSAKVNDSGELVLTFSDNSTMNAGVVAGKNGKNGVDGKDGYTPVKGVDYYTNADITEFKSLITSELAKLGQLKPEFADSIANCTDTTKLYVLPDGYIYAYMTIEAAGGTKEVTEQITGEFTEDYRLSTSTGALSKLDGAITSPLIDITQYGTKFTIHLDGTSENAVQWANASQSVTGNSMCLYRDGSWVAGAYTSATPIDGVTYNVKAKNDVDITFDTTSIANTAVGFTHVRFSGVAGRAENVSVSVTYEQAIQGGTETKWLNTGHSFVPADYEKRIIDVENDIENLKKTATDINGIPDYVLEEAENIADKVIALRNAHSFVFGAISDTHTTGSDTSAQGIVHAGMGMDTINQYTQLDLVLNFGDVMVGNLDDTYKSGFKHVKSALNSVSRAVPYIQMQGNHDQLAVDTTEEAQQKYFAYVGANNTKTVTDWNNRFRNYGYKDFEDQKLRVIYLNTTDVSETENIKNVWVTAQQFSWLINTAFDCSPKADPENWNIIVCSHHPLNWYHLDNLLTVLSAYKNKACGSITQDNTSINYDFTNSKAELVAHFHGHLHNFRVEKLGESNTDKVLSITIPNACFDRNNEYGTSAEYDESVHTLFGDMDENGNLRVDELKNPLVCGKTSDSANDTAFNVVVIDRDNRKIHCINYGAGIDREINY